MQRTTVTLAPLFFLAVILLSGCTHVPHSPAVTLHIAGLSEPLHVDGRLGEPVYGRVVPVTDFKVASRPDAQTQPTRAWLRWNEAGLWFAFAARDTTLVAAPPSENEHAVDSQDRVEIFIWPEDSSEYFCIEIAPDGAVHDYAARIYRQFDDSW
ncbi:MAG: hypothetical protein ACM3VT_11905, partial [Solirubrobacterales bacterium]